MRLIEFFFSLRVGLKITDKMGSFEASYYFLYFYYTTFNIICQMFYRGFTIFADIF